METSSFNVSVTTAKEVSYAVYNVVGEQVQSRDLGTYNQGVNTFEITGLPAGIYTIAVNQGNSTSTFKALVVE